LFFQSFREEDKIGNVHLVYLSLVSFERQHNVDKSEDQLIETCWSNFITDGRNS
jgi:hypothetical protein